MGGPRDPKPMGCWEIQSFQKQKTENQVHVQLLSLLVHGGLI